MYGIAQSFAGHVVREMGVGHPLFISQSSLEICPSISKLPTTGEKKQTNKTKKPKNSEKGLNLNLFAFRMHKNFYVF